MYKVFIPDGNEMVCHFQSDNLQEAKTVFYRLLHKTKVLARDLRGNLIIMAMREER